MVNFNLGYLFKYQNDKNECVTKFAVLILNYPNKISEGLDFWNGIKMAKKKRLHFKTFQPSKENAGLALPNLRDIPLQSG